ncbi:MAG: hypothetical protein SZ59_C0005G0064 [candidate division TM6 bacterium GW2011_GWF2_28_16]|nr:MAG: hypothetical protein SZ59_C0005G0064 [candidate division TM6 bacterium GW2011_GWF2_28_16]
MNNIEKVNLLVGDYKMKFIKNTKNWRKLIIISLAIVLVNSLTAMQTPENNSLENRLEKMQITTIKPEQLNNKQTTAADQKAKQIENVTKLNSLLQNILVILQNPNLEAEFNKFNNTNATIYLNNAVIIAVISKKLLGATIAKNDLLLLQNINLNGKSASEIVRDIFLYVIYKALEFNNNDLSTDTATLLNSIKEIINKKYTINFELLNNSQEIKVALLNDVAIQNILANPTIKKFILIMQKAPHLAVNFLNFIANDAKVTRYINMAPEFKNAILNIIKDISCLA